MIVRVYRNLKHGRAARPLYSIMVKGKVIAKEHRVLLSTAKFIVSEAGRQRVLRTKHKNVHAYVEGHLSDGCMGTDKNGMLTNCQAHYDPRKYGHFYTTTPDGVDHEIAGAGAVLLNEHGMSYAYGYSTQDQRGF